MDRRETLNELLEKGKKANAQNDLGPETVGFRLDADNRRILAKRARQAGLSVHEFARACVIDVLHEKEQIPEMRDAILQLHAELSDFRAKFAVGIEALLVTVNEVDAPEARAWVEQNLKPSP